MTDTNVKIQRKQVKHTFTDAECNQIGSELARALGEARGIESEFDQVKAGFKARTAEAETKINRLYTDRVNGYDYRMEDCVVLFYPLERKKHFIIKEMFDKRNGELPPAALIEDMTQDDFQAELVLAESKFENKDEIELFPRTETDFGTLIIGRFNSKWFSAVRAKIGRLDSEQPCSKHRPDAVKRGVKRMQDWLKEHLKDDAKGFEKHAKEVIEAHKERAE